MRSGKSYRGAHKRVPMSKILKLERKHRGETRAEQDRRRATEDRVTAAELGKVRP